MRHRHAAIGRFGHGPGIGQQTAGPRRGYPERVAQFDYVKIEHMRRRHHGPHRPDLAGWVKARIARLELARRLADPALHLDAFYQCN